MWACYLLGLIWGFFIGGLKTCLRRPCLVDSGRVEEGMEEERLFIERSALTASMSVGQSLVAVVLAAGGKTSLWVRRGLTMAAGWAAAGSADKDLFCCLAALACCGPGCLGL